MSERVAADVEELRATARQLSETAGQLFDVAEIAARTGVSATLLTSIPFSPGTGVQAERQLADAALRPVAASTALKLVSVELQTRAVLFEIAGSDRFAALMRGVGEFFGGLVEGVKGIGEALLLGLKLSPLRMTVDPLGWFKDATGVAKGLWHAATNPVEFFKSIVNWDLWAENPARALGKTIPDIILAIALKGGGKVPGKPPGKAPGKAPGKPPPKVHYAKRIATPSGTAKVDPANFKNSRRQRAAFPRKYADSRGKHTQVSDYSVDELKKALDSKPTDRELKTFVKRMRSDARNYGGQLGKEAADDYEGLVRRGLEQGKINSGDAIVHRANYEVGIDAKTLKATHCYTMRLYGDEWHIYPGGAC